jgi:hypothetical protein
LTTTGRLDTTFGTGGMVTTRFNGLDVATAVMVLTDGTIWVAGRTQDSSRYYDYALADGVRPGRPPGSGQPSPPEQPGGDRRRLLIRAPLGTAGPRLPRARLTTTWAAHPARFGPSRTQARYRTWERGSGPGCWQPGGPSQSGAQGIVHKLDTLQNKARRGSEQLSLLIFGSCAHKSKTNTTEQCQHAAGAIWDGPPSCDSGTSPRAAD